MAFQALATDYDGTLAHHGVVSDETVLALKRAREAGLKLLMVTGRELQSLFATFAHADLFDRIVAENGAVLYNPATRTPRTLAAPPPPELIRRLTAAGVPLEIGHSIVATVEPHEHVMLAAIKDLGLEWHLSFNKGSVMALPSSVTKASGLCPALEELGILPAHTVGIGDAENDHAFLAMCGKGVAVANALPALKIAADFVTQGAHGDGVREVIEMLRADPEWPTAPRATASVPS